MQQIYDNRSTFPSTFEEYLQMEQIYHNGSTFPSTFVEYLEQAQYILDAPQIVASDGEIIVEGTLHGKEDGPHIMEDNVMYVKGKLHRTKSI